MPDDEGLDELMGDEPERPDLPYQGDATEYVVGPRSSRRVVGIVAAVVVLIVAAGVIVGVTVGNHHKSSPTSNTIDTLPTPEPTVTVTVTATPTASASATATPSATASSSPTSKGLSTFGQASRVRTFYAYYDAINTKDWAKVWALGGKNLDSSYDAMVAGYSQTAKDLPYLVGISGDQLALKLLAFKTDGRAQLYSGSLTIERGQITKAQQTLSYADSDDSFSALAGDWYGHDRDLEISPGGLGVASFRTFTNCGNPADGCDQIDGNDIVDGGVIVFELNGGQANVATGNVTFSTVSRTAPTLTLKENATSNAVTLSVLAKEPFCNGKPYLNDCGA